MTDRQLNRRFFLKGASGAAVLATGGGALFAACGPDNKGGSDTPEANTAVKLPTLVEYTAVKPDLEGTPGGIRAGFFSYPKERPKAVPEPPGAGSTFKAMTILYYPLPPGPNKNKYWQALNKRLNAKLDMVMVPNQEYNTKLATTFASDDLPDFVMLTRNTGAPQRLPQILKTKFADLSEHLSGDAIKEYPNLANIPERAWKACVYNGGIYGLPVPRDAVGAFPFVRNDIIKKAGFTTKPENFEEFYELVKAVTDPKKNRYAFAQVSYPIDIVRIMQNTPAGWKNEGGKLTSANETDEHKKALETAAKFWKEGLIHPDAFADSIPFKEWFNAGQVVIQPDGYQGWTQYIADNVTNPDFELALLYVPAYEGGKARIPQGGSTFLNGLTAFKKAEPEKIKEQLRIANWLAAPFGSEEYFFRLYGEEGTHYTLDKNGDPQLTGVGRSETVIPIRYITENPSVIYQPGRPQDVKIQHEYESATVPDAIPNPVLGLYSNVEASKGGQLSQALDDARDEIIQGRKPLSAWDDAMDAWRKNGGDEIRQEFQDQLQKQGGPTGK